MRYTVFIWQMPSEISVSPSPSPHNHDLNNATLMNALTRGEIGRIVQHRPVLRVRLPVSVWHEGMVRVPKSNFSKKSARRQIDAIISCSERNIHYCRDNVYLVCDGTANVRHCRPPNPKHPKSAKTSYTRQINWILLLLASAQIHCLTKSHKCPKFITQIHCCSTVPPYLVFNSTKARQRFRVRRIESQCIVEVSHRRVKLSARLANGTELQKMALTQIHSVYDRQAEVRRPNARPMSSPTKLGHF